MRKATEDNRDLDQLAEYLESMDPTKAGFQNGLDSVALPSRDCNLYTSL